LLHLPDGRAAVNVNEAMKSAIREPAAELMRSITWDQGKELSSHHQFSIDTVPLPSTSAIRHSPWQRGSNENTNGSSANTCQRAPISERTARKTGPLRSESQQPSTARRSIHETIRRSSTELLALTG